MNFWPFAKKNADDNQYYSVEGDQPAAPEKKPAGPAVGLKAANPLKNLFGGGKLPPGNGTGKSAVIQGGALATPVEDTVPEAGYPENYSQPENDAQNHAPEASPVENAAPQQQQEDDYKPKAYRPQPTNGKGEYNPASLAESAIPHVPQPKPRKREETPLPEDVNNMFPEQAIVDDPADPLSNPVALDNLIKSVDDMLEGNNGNGTPAPEAVNPQEVFSEQEENTAENYQPEAYQPEIYQPEQSPADLNAFMADNSLEFVSTGKPADYATPADNVPTDTTEDYPGAPGYVVPEANKELENYQPENYAPQTEPVQPAETDTNVYTGTDNAVDPYAGFEAPAVTDFGDFVPAAPVDVTDVVEMPVENTPVENVTVNEADAALAPPPSETVAYDRNPEPDNDGFGDFDSDSLLAELKATKGPEAPSVQPVAPVPAAEVALEVSPVERVEEQAVVPVVGDADLAPPPSAEAETPTPVIPLDFVAEASEAPPVETPVYEASAYTADETSQPVQLTILPNIPQAVDITPPFTGETQPPVEYMPEYDNYTAEGFDETPGPEVINPETYDGEDYGDVHVPQNVASQNMDGEDQADYQAYDEAPDYEPYVYAEESYEAADYDAKAYGEVDDDPDVYSEEYDEETFEESFEEEGYDVEPFDNPYSDYNVIEGQPKYDLTPQAGIPNAAPAPKKKKQAPHLVQDFEARVILEESRFVKNSIDSLVDRYFSNSENDKKHYG